jgi:putative transposase
MESTMGIGQASRLLGATVQTLRNPELNDQLALDEGTWIRADYGAHHDRGVNAAVNQQRLATGACAAQTALPVTSQAVTLGTAAGAGSAGGGTVTPVRHEHGQQDGSGQEEIGEHLCALSR